MRMGQTVVSVGCVVASAILGAIAVYYLMDVHGGMLKHTPPCAPITGLAVIAVIALTGIGAALVMLGWWLARRRWLWLSVALLVATTLNVGALSVWGYWLGTGTLLSYDKWCQKVGMP